MADRVFVDAGVIRLVNNAFAFCFGEAKTSTTGGVYIEHNKYVDQVSTIIRALSIKDGVIISHFDEIDDSQAEINISSLKHCLVNNHDIAANMGKMKNHLPLELIFGFCRTLKKITKKSEFHITFKTADLQVIFHTILRNGIKVIFDKLFLFVPIFIPNVETQMIFIDSNKNSFTLSFDSWSTDRKKIDTHFYYQVDIGSALNINSPKYLKVAHPTAARIGVANKAKNIATFDNQLVLTLMVVILIMEEMKTLTKIVILNYFMKSTSVKNYLTFLEIILIWKSNILFKSLILDFKLIFLIQRNFNYILNIEVLLKRLECL